MLCIRGLCVMRMREQGDFSRTDVLHLPGGTITMTSVYDFSASDIDGKPVPLASYRGRVLLIVNVASECGFTKQYSGLQELHDHFQGQGFSVLGFPCNQFGGQEPGTEAEIKSFCTSKYNVTFPLFAKIDVNGEHEHPLYTFLKTEAKGILGSTAIKWNFTKFLISRTGEVVDRFAPNTAPAEIAAPIEKLLA